MLTPLALPSRLMPSPATQAVIATEGSSNTRLLETLTSTIPRLGETPMEKEGQSEDHGREAACSPAAPAFVCLA
jgi:hypothetical protein